MAHILVPIFISDFDLHSGDYGNIIKILRSMKNTDKYIIKYFFSPDTSRRRILKTEFFHPTNSLKVNINEWNNEIHSKIWTICSKWSTKQFIKYEKLSLSKEIDSNNLSKDSQDCLQEDDSTIVKVLGNTSLIDSDDEFNSAMIANEENTCSIDSDDEFYSTPITSEEIKIPVNNLPINSDDKFCTTMSDIVDTDTPNLEITESFIVKDGTSSGQSITIKIEHDGVQNSGLVKEVINQIESLAKDFATLQVTLVSYVENNLDNDPLKK